MNVSSTRRSVRKNVLGAALAALMTLGGLATAHAQSWTAPYLKPSIWNTPIKGSRTIVPLGWGSRGNWGFATGPDRTDFLTTSWSDPQVEVVQKYSSYGKGYIYIPASYTKREYDGSNQIVVILQPDGRTVVELQETIYPYYDSGRGRNVIWAYRPEKNGSPDYGNTYIHDIGLLGSHFGSGLPALGGSLRRGELNGTVPINHALNLLLPPEMLNSSSGGFRWPANRADDGYQSAYTGGNTQARMGCLMMLKSDFSTAGMTAEGVRLANALKAYGGYCTDGAAGGVFQVAMDEAEFAYLQGRFGSEPFRKYNGNTSPFHTDLIKILQELQVVTNNGPDSIGGGFSAPYAGEYRITNLDRTTRGRALEVGGGARGNPGPGTVNLWDWNGGNWQRWNLVSEANSEWLLKAKHSGQGMVAHNNNANDRKNVGTWDVFNDNRFRWYLRSNGDGTYRIQNKGFTNYTLSAHNDVETGNWYEWFGGDQQRWVFERL